MDLMRMPTKIIELQFLSSYYAKCQAFIYNFHHWEKEGILEYFPNEKE